VVSRSMSVTTVAKSFASTRKNLEKALRTGPVGITNLNIAFDTPSGSIGSRIGVKGNVADADGFLCDVIHQLGLGKVTANTACKLFELLLEPATTKAADGMPRTASGNVQVKPSQRQANFSADSSSSFTDLVGGR
jgi:phospholipid/cholesterol/gamma-HCH transport system substrate-binding protein